MPNLKTNYAKRPIVARDGSVYYIRRLHRVARALGVYIPRTLVESLGWKEDDALMCWVQKGVFCVTRVEVKRPNLRFIVVPPRETQTDDVVVPDEEI